MPNSSRTTFKRLAGTLTLWLALTATARADDDDGWTHDAVLESWLYAGVYRLTQPLPLPRWQDNAEGRLDLSARHDGLRLMLAPRFTGQRACPPAGADCQNTDRLRLNQGFASWASGSDQWVVGRELLSWGPAQFRSPSNPFYFDSGRTDPLADTPGIDLARWTVSDGGWRWSSVYVGDTRTVAAPRQRDTWLFKADRQTDDGLYSLIASQASAQHQGPFWGGFAQWSLNDAWLFYGEASLQRGGADDVGRWLTGASYTAEGGHILSAEYLFNGAGLSTTGDISPLLQAAPPSLLNRHYLWASVQSNPQALARYWRLEWRRNLDDRSTGWVLYGEKRLQARLSGFAMLTLGEGGAGSEFGGLYRSGVTLGLKLYLL
ncbi:hypothetical protein [Paludibacterium sp.]|uniref:hypothetical protein n=2 Tax=Paludibacterium sp. TaxID=1917523 RepID=UPI0025FF569E|nr:hypothetical protein [Paludibacterium sp.]MBV8649297.1 hypothetical protein [Paludibacterium sp.]